MRKQFDRFLGFPLPYPGVERFAAPSWMPPVVAVGYMIGSDEELQTDRLFPAKRGLDRRRLGNGYQATPALFRRDELRSVMG